MCPAVSKKQQQFMGIVHAIQKGEMKPSDATPEARAAAKSMKKKDVKDFAKTKHKGLPTKVPENVEEGNFQGSISQDARGLSFGTMSDLIGTKKRSEIEKVQNNFVKFALKNKSKYKDWYGAWKVFWKQNESINEVKSDKDMVKDGLRYAKKKYKYNVKDMKELALDMLQYIRSGEIDDQGSMEAYIDFRNDEGEIKESIRSVVRELIIEMSVIDQAKDTLKGIFRRKKGKIPDKEVNSYIFNRGFLKTHGEKAVRYAWNELIKNNQLKRHGNDWVMN